MLLVVSFLICKQGEYNYLKMPKTYYNYQVLIFTFIISKYS